MEFVCEKNLLINSLTPAYYAVSVKNTISSLEGFLLKADAGGNSLQIYGYDLEKGIRVNLSGEGLRVHESGFIIVNAAKFLQIVKNIPNGEVSVYCGPDLQLKVCGGRSEFMIHASAGEDYPVMPVLDAAKSFSVPQKELREMMAGVLFAAGQNNIRSTFNGIYFEIEDGDIRLTAVDGVRLAHRVRKGVITQDGAEAYDGSLYVKFIAPRSSMSELLKMLSDGEGLAEVELAEKHVIVSFGNIMFFSRLVDGEYIDYKRIIPYNVLTRVAIDRESFIQSVERASIILDERVKYIKLDFCGDGTLKISGSTSVGNVYDECPAMLTGEPLTIGFNSRNLAETLRAADEEQITLCLESATKAMIVYPKDEEGHDSRFTYLVLPVRLLNG